MKQNWWKILGAILLIFSFVSGLVIPMKPGLISSEQSAVSTSEAPFSVRILGYNTHFDQTGHNLQVWLTNGSGKPVKTCAGSVTVQSDNVIVAEFPPVAPIGDPVFGLAVYNDADGLLFMENAISTSDTARTSLVQSCSPVIKENPSVFAFPFRYVLYESIRNLFYHVPMWFTMIALLTWAVWNNFRYLRTFDQKYDTLSNFAIRTGIVFGILGLITGSLWARVTWGAWWVDDVKLNGTAITMLAYMAYIVLRNSMEDVQKKARIAAIYSIFAYVMMIALIGLLPRLQGTDSLHPGNGGNPGFNRYDLDSTMRPIFYSAVAGWILIGIWIAQLQIRIHTIKERLHNN